MNDRQWVLGGSVFVVAALVLILLCSFLGGRIGLLVEMESIMEQPSRKDIDDVLNEVMEQVDQGGSRFPGMSYEAGLEAGILWVLGERSEHPYPEE